MKTRFVACAAGALALGGCGSSGQGSGGGAATAPAMLISSHDGAYSFTKSVAVARDGVGRIWFVTNVKPDCSSGALGQVRLIGKPAHGDFSQAIVEDFASLPPTSPAFHCNTRRVAGVEVSYRANVGYVGTDSLTFDILYPDGRRAHVDAALNVI